MVNVLHRVRKMAVSGAALAHVFDQSLYTYVSQSSSCAATIHLLCCDVMTKLGEES